VQPIAWDQIKTKMRETWMAGDFGRIARFTADAAADFVERLDIRPGMQVLDVACGTGNLAIPAARKGAAVTGIDIAPNLLEQARQRAAAEGLTARFEEGDAEQLPYSDGQFDVVMSMFGAMFAPRPERVASELARVCRRGGRIAMANWTAEGFVGKSFAVTARHIPPPVPLPAPVLWGDEATVRERLAGAAKHIATQRRTVRFEYPFPPAEVVQFFREYFGPTKMGFARLDEAGQKAHAAALEQLWREYNEASDGHTLVAAEYLEVVVDRA
jgi:ubiquinone/menaquinone biosynthesis C-methylase UbiE